MVRLMYFASLREALGIDHEQVNLPDGIDNVAALLQWLKTRSDNWCDALSDPHLLVAVNQEMATTDTLVRDGDEVAWFPPVTGG